MPHNGEVIGIRVGMHTGACMTGLVGTRIPKFSIFGDTMNTASRMESTCIPGEGSRTSVSEGFGLIQVTVCHWHNQVASSHVAPMVTYSSILVPVTRSDPHFVRQS